MPGQNLYIGVDVGSGSARAGLFNSTGQLLHTAVKAIQINNPESGYYEQSSEDIWSCVCWTVQKVVAHVPNRVSDIKGLSFCATCSLVSIGDDSALPVPVSKSADPKWNIIMWMDHRAAAEAELINSTGHPVLQYVGGKISLEMETPKLLWLQRNLPASFAAAKHYFDLGDYLRWRATGGCLHRSVCCITCKWTFINQPASDSKSCSHWDKSYFQQIGLTQGDAARDGEFFSKITADKFSYPGDSFPLSKLVAKEFGLGDAANEVQVGFSMIDAHSGVLGMLGCKSGPAAAGVDMSNRLGIICGTSNCHMALNKKCLQIPGIWGPYYGVIFNDYYLSEGGQTAAGSLLDHIVKSHVAYEELFKECASDHGKVLAKLESLLNTMQAINKESFFEMTKELHIWPDFHGNRSPIADPSLKGMISGLILSGTRENLAVVYLATIQALAYASRHIKETMEVAGHKFTELVLCGGLVKSKLFLQLHADIIGLPVLIPECPEPVLLGAAMSAAAAVQNSSCEGNQDLGKPLENVVHDMAGSCAAVILPNGDLKEFHMKKYMVFLKMWEHQLEYRKIME